MTTHAIAERLIREDDPSDIAALQAPGPRCPRDDHDDERDGEPESEREVWRVDGQAPDVRPELELGLEGLSSLRG